jgi:hypothetical protein
MGANAQIAVPAFTAGQILTAAQQTQINTGIPVFATTTTRDAAFGGTGEKTLAEGQFAYIEATNTTQYYDGAAWQSVGVTPGLVPIVPTSVAVGSGTASVGATGLITFTTVGTNLSINGAFSATYRNYLMQYNLTTTANGANFGMRLRVAGTDNTASSYAMAGYDADTTGIVSRTASSQTSFSVIAAVDDDNAGNTSSTIFYQPFETKVTTVHASGVSPIATVLHRNIFGIHNAATSYDGFSFIVTSGTITGTAMIYGYTI